jgi:hypothetical protein
MPRRLAHVRPTTPLAPVDVGAAFVLCAAAVPLGHRLLHRHAEPPRTLVELAALLRQSEPPLYAVPMTDQDPEVGFYLCEQPRPREQLQQLRRLAEHSDRWRGVVFCEMDGYQGGEIGESDWQRWGEHGMRIGRFVLFGDPALLGRIRQAIPAE